MSQIFEQVNKEQKTTWPLNQSFDNPIVAISSDNHCSNFSYFGFSDKQGNHANDEKRNTMRFDPDQVKKVNMAYRNNDNKYLNVMELFDKDNRSLGKIGGDYRSGPRHEVKLEDGERIFGFKSASGASGWH